MVVRTHRMTWAILGTAVALLLTVPASTAAVSVTGTPASQPDGRIRLQKLVSSWNGTTRYSESWTGDDVYTTTAAGQALRERYYAESPGWDRWVLGVSIENDGASSDQMSVQATGTDVLGWTVKYFVGTANVTSAVLDGTFTTPLLAPGEEYLLKVKVTREERFFTDPVRRLISVTSDGNPNKVDAVKLVFKVFTCGC
jgi:hypothetical protein